MEVEALEVLLRMLIEFAWRILFLSAIIAISAETRTPSMTMFRLLFLNR